MKESALDQARPPWFLANDSTSSELTNLAWRWVESGFAVRIVRGQKMKTVQAMFDEMAAALQFPDYFGENWPAFGECLADLDWLPAGNGYAIAILNAADVLADEPRGLEVLVRILNRVASEWSEPVAVGEPWDRPAIPFHIVLQIPENRMKSVRKRWSDAGADIELPKS